MLKYTKLEHILKVPIDQSKFDYSPSRRMITLFFNKIVWLCQVYGSEEEIVMSLLLRDSMLSLSSTVNVDG